MTSHSPDPDGTDPLRRLGEGFSQRDPDGLSSCPHSIEYMGRRPPWLMDAQAEGFFRRGLLNIFGSPSASDMNWRKDF
jgi:hypothetical protein